MMQEKESKVVAFSVTAVKTRNRVLHVIWWCNVVHLLARTISLHFAKVRHQETEWTKCCLLTLLFCM